MTFTPSGLPSATSGSSPLSALLYLPGLCDGPCTREGFAHHRPFAHALPSAWISTQLALSHPSSLHSDVTTSQKSALTTSKLSRLLPHLLPYHLFLYSLAPANSLSLSFITHVFTCLHLPWWEGAGSAFVMAVSP